MNDVLDYFRGICKLKRTVRRGWQLHGVANPESVADHIFGVSALALFFGIRRGLDLEKLSIMALVHDIGEIEVGDITPSDGIAEGDKRRIEERAACDLLSRLDPSGRFFELWKDYEYERTGEGKLMKDIDRFEMLLQAFLYEGSSARPLDEFYAFAEERVQDAEMLDMVRELRARRDAKDLTT